MPQVHKSQQEQLVDFWLRQHAIVKSELSSLLTMASAAFNAEDIGVEELQVCRSTHLLTLIELVRKRNARRRSEAGLGKDLIPTGI